MEENSDTNKANDTKNYDYNDWYDRHKNYLIEQFDFITNHSKNDLKEDYENYKIDFKFFCYYTWKSMLYKKEGEAFIQYMLLDGKFDLSYKIDEFVVDYANEIIEIDKKVQNSLHNIVNKKEFYRLFYMIYASMLGVEKTYVNKVYNSIIESELYKSLTEKQKLEFEKEINIANSKIVRPKNYDKENLADYYFDVAKRKKGNPSVRDLAKGSEWNKDKWNDALKNDYKLIGNIFMRLQTEIKSNTKLTKEDWFKIMYNEYQIKFADEQLKLSKNQNKSYAREFKENIPDENS